MGFEGSIKGDHGQRGALLKVKLNRPQPLPGCRLHSVADAAGGGSTLGASPQLRGFRIKRTAGEVEGVQHREAQRDALDHLIAQRTENAVGSA